MYDDLKREGLYPWLDREDLLPGQNWRATIPQVIRECRYFLLLISEKSVSKQGLIQKEQKVVLELLDESPENDIFIIPARLDNTEPLDERLRSLHWADLSASSYEQDLKKIMRVLNRSDKEKDEQEDKYDQEIEFVNRLSELQLITNIHCPPYLLIDAPMGYGKTRLIEAVNNELKQQNWLCISINLRAEKFSSIKEIGEYFFKLLGKKYCSNFDFTTPEDAGSEVGLCLLNAVEKEQRKGILIQIDEAEKLNDNESLVKELLNRFIPELADTIHHTANPIKLRLMFAGRYILNWQQKSYKLRFKPILLSPFDFDAVYQSVEYFDTSYKRVNKPSEYKKDFSAWLMNFTGGHPKCMAEIFINNYGLPMSIINNKERELYEKIIKPIIIDIKDNISENLRDIVERLSVVRRFNARLLRRFIESELIQCDEGNKYTIEDLLCQTYFVNKSGGFILSSGITRRLLAIDLVRNNFKLFIQIYNQTISFYEERLKDYESHAKYIIAIEILFQKLQYISLKKNKNKKQFFKDVNTILKFLVSIQDAVSLLDNLKEALNNDWEFRFMLNYLFREGSYDEKPFNELMRIIVNYLENLKQGVKNA